MKIAALVMRSSTSSAEAEVHASKASQGGKGRRSRRANKTRWCLTTCRRTSTTKRMKNSERRRWKLTNFETNVVRSNHEASRFSPRRFDEHPRLSIFTIPRYYDWNGTQDSYVEEFPSPRISTLKGSLESCLQLRECKLHFTSFPSGSCQRWRATYEIHFVVFLVAVGCKYREFNLTCRQSNFWSSWEIVIKPATTDACANNGTWTNRKPLTCNVCVNVQTCVI